MIFFFEITGVYHIFLIHLIHECHYFFVQQLHLVNVALCIYKALIYETLTFVYQIICKKRTSYFAMAEKVKSARMIEVTRKQDVFVEHECCGGNKVLNGYFKL